MNTQISNKKIFDWSGKCKKYHHDFFIMYLVILSVPYYIISKEYKINTLRGKVVNQVSQKGLPFCEISITNKVSKEVYKDTTDQQGAFIIKNFQPNLYDILVSSDLYYFKKLYNILLIEGENKFIDIELKKKPVFTELDKIIVESQRLSSKKEYQSTSVVKLTNQDIVNSTGSFGDVNKVIQTLPGVKTGDGIVDNDFSNHFFVRGGNGGENVFIIDGIEVNNISQFGQEHESGGIVSFLNLEFIESLEFYAAAFPPESPPKLASITEIKLRRGNQFEHKFKFDLNMAGAALIHEGPVKRGKSSYILSASTSYLKLIEKLIGNIGQPRYQTIQGKFNTYIGKNSNIFLNVIYSNFAHNDKNFSGRSYETNFDYDGRLGILGIGWDYFGDRFLHKTLVSVQGRIGLNKEVQKNNGLVWNYFKNKNIKLQLKYNGKFIINDKNSLKYGLNGQRIFCKENYQEDFRLRVLDTVENEISYMSKLPDSNFVILRTYNEINQAFDEKYLIGDRMSGYAGISSSLGPFTLNFSIRNDYYTLNHEHGFSPRFGLIFDAGMIGTFSASTGIYYQFPSYDFLLFQYEDGLDNIELKKVYQGVLGYSRALGKSTLFGIEAYYKKYPNSLLYTFDINSAGYIVGRDLVDEFSGRKKAAGIEIYLKKKKRDIFFYSLAYSLSDINIRYSNNNWYSDDYNFVNNASLEVGTSFKTGEHILSLRFDLRGGTPYTGINYELSNMYKHTIYNSESKWNEKNRKPYTTISLRYQSIGTIRGHGMGGYFEVTNLFNTKHIVEEGYSYQKKRGVIIPVGGFWFEF